MLMFALGRPVISFARGVSTLQRNAANKGLLAGRSMEAGRRYMGGHGPDISKMEAALYIIVGGGGFALFGLYQTKLMRDRIEAFETGKTLPFKSLTDDELLVFREKFRRLHREEEDEDEEEESAEPSSSSGDDEPDEVAPVQDEDLSLPRRIAKSSKDTVIFIEAEKE